MDGAVLADLRPGADLAACGLAVVFEILRREANGAERVEDRALTHRCLAIDNDMRHEADVIMQHDAGTDVTKRADTDPRADPGARVDDRRWVDHHAIPTGQRGSFRIIEHWLRVRGHLIQTKTTIVADHVGRSRLNDP